MRGITVQLAVRAQTGTDAFRRPTYAETLVDVENVLVAPVSGEEVVQTLDLTGRRAVYRLAIPKGDAHDWENARVVFFGRSWRVIGKPTEGIEALIPLQWNKTVKVESYVQDKSNAAARGL